MDKDKVIETERLILRPFRMEDKQDYFNNITHDKEVLEYFVCPYTENIEELNMEKLIEGPVKSGRYHMAIELKENHEVIGMILQCNAASEMFNTSEVGYAIGKKYWNKGYTSEALKAFIDLLFEEGVHKVCSCHFEPNIASKRVMEKCGMIYEGKRIDETYYHGRYWNSEYYYILNTKV